jgi:hypothetical protein
MEVSGQLHAPAALPQGKNPWFPLDRRLRGPRAGLDRMVKRKIPTLCRDSSLRSSSPQLSAIALNYLERRNFDEETSWKASTWKTEKAMEE